MCVLGGFVDVLIKHCWLIFVMVFPKSIICTLPCIQHFYHVLMCMRRPQGKGFELARKHINSCVSELDSMLKLEEFLRSNNTCGTVRDATEDATTASGCRPIGFDSSLNSRLSAPTPPRAIKLLSWKKVSAKSLVSKFAA